MVPIMLAMSTLPDFGEVVFIIGIGNYLTKIKLK
jgi:hypothetical protein